MTPTGKIVRIPNEHVVQRGDERLPAAWIASTLRSNDALPNTTRIRRGAVPSPPLTGSDKVIMVTFVDNQAAQSLDFSALAGGGARLYVVAPVGWEPGTAERPSFQTANILIRRVAEVPVTGLATPGATTLWVGSKCGGSAPWAVTLDASQASAFRRMFLRLFWHEAVDEGFGGGASLKFRPAAERPFDVPDLSRNAPVRMIEAGAPVEWDLRDAWVYSNGGPPPEGLLKKLWFPANGQHHGRLIDLVRRGVEVLWQDHDLPDFAFREQRGVVVLPGKNRRLRIETNEAQTADLTRILGRNSEWKFVAGARIGDHSAEATRFWLDGAVGPEVLNREEVVDEAPVHADELRRTHDSRPKKWSDASPLVLAVRHRWMTFPPRVPTGATKDDLVIRWEKAETEFSGRIEKLRSSLELAEQHCGRLSAAFSRLVGAILGFDQTHRNLASSLEALSSVRLSEGTVDRARESLARLTEIDERLTDLRTELDAAERKAKDDEDRDRQEKAWRSRVDVAQQKLSEKRDELSRAMTKKTGIAESRIRLDEEVLAATPETKTDLDVQRRRLSDDQAKLEKEIARLQSEIAALTKSSDEAFVFQPAPPSRGRTTSQGERFVPTASGRPSTIAIPNERLPEVGTLKNWKGVRYLVIPQWEDLDQGESAAVRLNAKLVAPEDA